MSRSSTTSAGLVQKLIVHAMCAMLALQGQSSLALAADEPIRWRAIGRGLEQANFQLPGNPLISPSVVIVRGTPPHVTPRVIRASEFGWKRTSVRALCKTSGASVCINSNFFDEQGKPLGLVISRGILHQKTHNGGGTLTGILYATADRINIAHRSNFSTEGVLEATQAGPRLVSEGAPVVGLKTQAPTSNLSIACVDRENRILLMRVTLAVFGGSLTNIQETLLRPEIGCYEAINFDGGGSSQMYVAGEIPGHVGATKEEDFPGRDEVPVAVGLFVTKAENEN